LGQPLNKGGLRPVGSDKPQPSESLPLPRLVPIAGPIFIELLLGIAVGLIGTWLAARLGDRYAAAFALTNNVMAMLFIFFRVVGAGISVVIAQNLGAGDKAGANQVALACLAASTWMGVIAAVCAVVFAAPLLALMNAPAEVMPLALPFFQWLAIGLLLDSWNATAASVLRAHLRVKDTLVTFAVMNVLLVLLAAVLMPRFGLVGFALAVVIARAVALLMHLIFWRVRLALSTPWRCWLTFSWAQLAPVLHIGLPGAAENIFYRLAFMVSVMVAGTLGAQGLATQAYTLQVMYVVLMFGLATGLGVEIVVGHMVGAGQLQAAHRLVRRALGVGLAVSVLVAIAAALLGPRLLSIFTQDKSVIASGALLLWWTVILEPGRTFNLVVINALRAAGDARFPVLAGAGSMLIVLAGGAWLLGVTMGLGLVGVWIAYAADEWIRGLIMWCRWQSLAWTRHAREARRRGRASMLLVRNGQ
jgi:putative MATE family efflux protein